MDSVTLLRDWQQGHTCPGRDGCRTKPADSHRPSPGAQVDGRGGSTEPHNVPVLFVHISVTYLLSSHWKEEEPLAKCQLDFWFTVLDHTELNFVSTVGGFLDPQHSTLVKL